MSLSSQLGPLGAQSLVFTDVRNDSLFFFENVRCMYFIKERNDNLHAVEICNKHLGLI
jgi:hypothetical protein